MPCPGDSRPGWEGGAAYGRSAGLGGGQASGGRVGLVRGQSKRQPLAPTGKQWSSGPQEGAQLGRRSRAYPGQVCTLGDLYSVLPTQPRANTEKL